MMSVLSFMLSYHSFQKSPVLSGLCTNWDSGVTSSREPVPAYGGHHEGWVPPGVAQVPWVRAGKV